MFALGTNGGPLPRYRDEHLVYLMMQLLANGKMSRNRLADLLGLGEGSVRSAVAHLSAEGMVTVSRRGVSLSDAGRSFIEGLGMLVVPMACAEDTGLSVVAVIVKDGAKNLEDGFEQMLAAAKAGAENISVYKVDNGAIQVHRHTPDFKDGDMGVAGLRILDEGDAVVLCASGTMEHANLAAVAAGIGIRKAEKVVSV